MGGGGSSSGTTDNKTRNTGTKEQTEGEYSFLYSIN